MMTVEAESFTNFSPRLFNCIPRAIRDRTRHTTKAFNRRLDKFPRTFDTVPIHAV